LETALDFEVWKVSEGSDDLQSGPHPRPNLQPASLPNAGNEASCAGGQNAQLRGHWAYEALRDLTPEQTAVIQEFNTETVIDNSMGPGLARPVRKGPCQAV